MRRDLRDPGGVEDAAAGEIGAVVRQVYGTLHQFTEAGLLRQVRMGAGKAYFDTYTGSHHHFQVEGEETVFDVPAGEVRLHAAPAAPPGFAVVGVDVVVRLKRLG